MHPIVDIHCDLLCYLANDLTRSALNLDVRCSLPQLRAGHVKLQTMAIFTETEAGSTQKGQKQLTQFKQLPQKYPQDFQIIKKNDSLAQVFTNDSIKMLLAIENASGFFEEEETLEKGFQRIEEVEKETGKILYASLTWNFENRFGGGAHTKVGIKEDGQRLLDFLHQKRIAIDLSHTSDQLANDILNYVDKKNLKVPVIASHSNFRSVASVVRNLPDEIAQEILRREGIIGFVFYRDFVGKNDPYNIVRQIEHLFKLGGEKQGCFGADFFSGDDLPPDFKKPSDQLFFPDFGDASTYGALINFWQKHLGLSTNQQAGIAYQNFIHFYNKNIE